MTESYAVAALIRSRFKQRILHTCNLFLHGLKRLPDDGGAHSLGAEVPHFLDLAEIEKGIIFAGANESRFLPGLKLARSEPQNALQVCSAITVQRSNSLLRLSGNSIQ